MHDTQTDTALPSSLDKVLTALAGLGQATAATIGQQAAIGYSTTTPKLRALEEAGHAERFRNDEGRTLWRLTDAGTAAATEAAKRGASGDITVAPPTIEAEDDRAAIDVPDGGGPIDLTPDTDPEPDADHDHDAGQATRDVDPDLDAEAEQPRSETDPAPSHQQAAGDGLVIDGTGEAGQADQDRSADLDDQPTSNEPGVEAANPDPPSGDDPAATDAPATAGRPTPANPKRPKGALRGAVLKLLQDRPATAYKVGEICKLLDQANQGSGVNKASAGAVANALDKLVGDGSVRCVNDKPATFQAA